MRWGQLFEDLEGRWQSDRARMFDAEVADLTRAERAGVDLAARLAASRGASLALTLRDGSAVSGVLADATAQWVLLHSSPGERLVPRGAISAVRGLSSRAVPLGRIEQRLTLGAALRALAQDRSWVAVRAQGAEMIGLLESVGADFVEVAPEEGVPVTVPFDALLEVRSAQG
ncbi:hypothetical protein [Demequina zhanjiangensis]|uniref:Uncharacterized protein n=1 Tax=Demequina zhanjiangensis TaxID=3051659 RepID=A0ABT8FXR2_9MICO|nr:hypothetical protein [Demequina sp. SYSU T00b26]MDN4471696.1 hypothetical protein [Demequina sp. SYSU T00b26]